MEEKLKQIINYYGVASQQRKLQEEVFELQESIIKWENQEPNLSYIKANELKQEIEKEYADVLNVLEQFKIHYRLSEHNINENRIYKIDRQLERIKDGKDK